MKVDFGIHISDTSASIARMIDGQPTVIKTNTLKDKIPLCVGFNKRGNLIVGDAAYNALITSKIRHKDFETNYYSNFLRTAETDKTYYFSNTNQVYSSEQLLGFVIKTLKSFVKDEYVKASVITVPDRFSFNQIEAIKTAGKLGGLEQVEIVQESIAASMAYGLDVKNRDGYWLVFNLGRGTFDTALLKGEDGIMKIIDTEGDNYLGGKNLDYAIVDEIIIPYLKDNYVVDSILQDDNKRKILQGSLKYYAEETKIQMSFNDTHNILSDFCDIPGEDDEGEEFEMDITVTQDDFKKVVAPIFQRTIDICKNLLERNNLTGDKLDSLILVGGPTYSPILRRMLEEQIKKPDANVEPKTVVVKGAALYASRVNFFNNNTSNKSFLIEIEDLLFKLLEEGKIDTVAFQKYFDVIFDIKKMNLLPDKKILNKIYKELENVAQKI